MPYFHYKNVKKSALYMKSLQFSSMLYQLPALNADPLSASHQSLFFIKNKAIDVLHFVSSSLGQHSIKILFRELNQAKENLMTIMKQLAILKECKIVPEEEFSKIESVSIEVLKLIHYEFGKISKELNINPDS